MSHIVRLVTGARGQGTQKAATRKLVEMCGKFLGGWRASQSDAGEETWYRWPPAAFPVGTGEEGEAPE